MICAQSRRFAELLVANTASNGPGQGLLLIEDVLSVVVAPLAKLEPVLFLVMDGMSMAVWRELAPDLAQQGWQEWRQADGLVSGRALSTLPSVTKYSRTSLLCGRLIEGAQNTEKRGFQEHPELRAFKAALFHK